MIYHNLSDIICIIMQYWQTNNWPGAERIFTVILIATKLWILDTENRSQIYESGPVKRHIETLKSCQTQGYESNPNHSIGYLIPDVTGARSCPRDQAGERLVRESFLLESFAHH